MPQQASSWLPEFMQSRHVDAVSPAVAHPLKDLWIDFLLKEAGLPKTLDATVPELHEPVSNHQVVSIIQASEFEIRAPDLN
jgi:hypothetical protein